MKSDDNMLARLAALKTVPWAELKAQWVELHDSTPPSFSRRYIEARLAYRIQELTHGGLAPATLRRLQDLGDAFASGGAGRGRARAGLKPITGTRLIREWQGAEHVVSVTQDGYEWQGRPYRSLSAIARAITGTRWNGWLFFGLKNQRGKPA